MKLWKTLEENVPGEKKPFIPQIPLEYLKNNQDHISNFLFIASNSKGTHSLQVFIENLEGTEFKVAVSRLIEKENPLFFAYNKHATHVLIKYIELTPEDPYLTKLYNVITKNFTELSKDSHGLPLVKKCLAWIRTPSLKKNMIKELSTNSIYLAQNPYGNYSLQVAFDVSKQFKFLNFITNILFL